MVSTKLNNLIEKYNLTNLIKVIVILIVLFLLYRIFIESNKYQIPYNLNKNIYEGFADLNNGSVYGNVISLLEPTNIPSYTGNKCKFILSNTFRIDTIIFLLNAGSPATPKPDNSSFWNSEHRITISFIDGNGNTKNLKAVPSAGTTDSGSPPEFAPDSSNYIKLTNITDENNLPIYTSQIIFNVMGNNNTIDRIVDTNGYNYIKGFGFYGGDKNLPTQIAYSNTSSRLIKDDSFQLKTTPSTPSNTPNQQIYNFKTGSDKIIYSLQLSISSSLAKTLKTDTSTTITPITPTPARSTDSPYSIQITYQNTIYTQNIFTINTPYIVRSDYHVKTDDTSTSYAFIFLTEPIIANSITFTISNSPITGDVTKFMQLNISNLIVLNNVPSAADISDYKQTINLLQSTASNEDNTNVCPSINELVNTQTKTQQICDNLEYQDKVKSEKLRLERNKQYLLKLKDQQDQIDQLNTAIQTLENSREARSNTADQLRVLQYQKQKADASSVRDLANQRIESQENNQLYMDVKVNTT